MRRLIALIALATAAALSLVVLPAGSATAGGPTSVLIVNPDEARSAAAMAGSPAYENLAKALDVFGTPTGEQSTRAPASFMESDIRLTWLIHDVTAWRVDGLVLEGRDVWVSTAQTHDGSSVFEQPTTWHQVKDPKLLLATLTSLGVIGTTSPTALPTATTPEPQAIAPAAEAATRAADKTTPITSSSGVPALAGTFAGGLLLGAIGVTALSRRTPRTDPRMDPETGPETDLETDLETNPEEATQNARWRPVDTATHLSDKVPAVGFAPDATRPGLTARR